MLVNDKVSVDQCWSDICFSDGGNRELLQRQTGCSCSTRVYADQSFRSGCDHRRRSHHASARQDALSNSQLTLITHAAALKLNIICGCFCRYRKLFLFLADHSPLLPSWCSLSSCKRKGRINHDQIPHMKRKLCWFSLIVLFISTLCSGHCNTNWGMHP